MFLEASALVSGGFVVLPVLVAVGLVLACKWAGSRTLLVAGAVFGWMLLTLLLAASGLLRRFDATPPPFAIFALAVIAIGVYLPFSPLGTLLVRALPLWALVGFQAFRLPLELVMHRAYLEGVMPVQMSYSGQNYDIVTGITAGALGLWLLRRPAPRWIVAAWNVLGFALLLNVVAVAVASTPVFAAFGPDRLNLFVTYPPFVWLPAVLVAAALAGHLLVWRRLALRTPDLPDPAGKRA